MAGHERIHKRDPKAIERARLQAAVDMDFVVSLYAEQVPGGRYFTSC